jgi:transcriptional regulator with XRE-family HTH domain
MTKEKLKILLKQAGLTKKELSEILGITQGSINCWGTTQNIPYWVESWLENYIKAKVSDKVIEAVKPFVKNN